MISFVVPAHNEQACLGRTLQAIHDAARATGEPYEVIVVVDASTDATADVARKAGAIVVPVNHRQIAATRNAADKLLTATDCSLSMRIRSSIAVSSRRPSDISIGARLVAVRLRDLRDRSHSMLTFSCGGSGCSCDLAE
jgi:glycosyltransferase involved in cell wall biosynthesis